MSGVGSETLTIGGSYADYAGSTGFECSAGDRQWHHDAVGLPEAETNAALGIVARLQKGKERLHELFDHLFCDHLFRGPAENKRAFFGVQQEPVKELRLREDLEAKPVILQGNHKIAYDAVRQELEKERRLREDLEVKMIILQENHKIVWEGVQEKLVEECRLRVELEQELLEEWQLRVGLEDKVRILLKEDEIALDTVQQELEKEHRLREDLEAKIVILQEDHKIASDGVQQKLVKERQLREDLEAKIIVLQEDLVQQHHLAVERLVNLNTTYCTMEELEVALSGAQLDLEIH